MIHVFLPFPMCSSPRVSHLYVFLSSLWLTWLADPALVTLVYPNWMQYMPHVLQEASLLDGVDAGVRGNGRRFSKTSSHPPCRHYAFNPPLSLFSHDIIVPFVLADSFLSHDPLRLHPTLLITPTLPIPFVPFILLNLEIFSILSGPLYPNTPSVLFCAFPRPASPTSSTYPIGCPSPT